MSSFLLSNRNLSSSHTEEKSMKEQDGGHSQDKAFCHFCNCTVPEWYTPPPLQKSGEVLKSKLHDGLDS